MSIVKRFSLGVLFLFLTKVALADLYVGVGAGVASADLDRTAAESVLGANMGTEESDTGYRAFAGYRLGLVGIEASYTRLGEFGFSSSTDSIRSEIEGVGAAVVGFVSMVDDLSLVLKAGAFAWDSANAGSVAVADQSGTDPFYGVGLQSVVGAFLVRGEYERFDEIDVDLVSISLGASF